MTATQKRAREAYTNAGALTERHADMVAYLRRIAALNVPFGTPVRTLDTRV